MPRTRSSLPVRALLGALLPTLAACDVRGAAATTSTSAASDSVYIGVAAARDNGTDTYFRGVQLAVDRLNAERPQGARPFAMAMPPEAQPTQVAVAAQFRDDPRVIAVVGHTGSAQTMEAAPVYADLEDNGRRALAAVTPTATNPAVTRDGEWVFRVCPTDVDGARALARHALDSLGVRTVAVIYRNDLFGRGFTNALARELAKGGARVTERDPYLGGITEYRAYTARATRNGVDALVVAGGGPDAADIIRTLRAVRGTARVLGSDDIASLGDHPETQREFRGTRYVTFYEASSAPGDEAARFRATYRSANGVDPTQQAALSYDAAMVIGRAVLAVGADRKKVRDRIAATGSTAPPHQGVTGRIAFDAQGDAMGKTVSIGEVGG